MNWGLNSMKSYLITGSTGFLGRQIIEAIIRENNCDSTRFILPVRNINKARNLYTVISENTKIGLEFVECSMENMTVERFPSNMTLDYIIHCATPTSSKYMISHPAETADAIVLGTRNALEFAKFFHVKSMVCLSSMEVYGQVDDEGKPRAENELGTLSLNVARSCYPMGKRMAEHYCHIYQQEYGVPVKIARLSQVFGKGVAASDNRVFMQFARSAMEGKDIVLKTRGQSLGNYCATEDAISGILTILKNGNDGAVYNVVNEDNTMKIIDMAQIVASEIADGNINVVLDLEDSSKTGYAPDTGLRMSGEKLRGLGWKPTKNIVEMYQDVVKEIKFSSR